ncbi:MAG: DNA polymerase Y family protein [Labilithrix sp.]|nr:DNA polymerase Y family protein [Labilithrix sp.]
MRVCAVSLPELRIELVRGELDPASAGLPLAVVVAPAPMTEAKLLGNTRLSVVSREARALGVSPGHTIAQARARAGDLAVRVVRPDAVRDVLARIAEVGLAFGATVSFSCGLPDTAARPPDATFGDVVWIDVTGCAHLHAPRSTASIFDGETILASRLAGVIASLGHTCAVAIADGPRVAAMLARASAESAARAALGSLRRRASRGRDAPATPSLGRAGSGERRAPSRSAFSELEPIVVRPGDNAQAIAPLPVGALPLPPEDVRWLAKIGVRTVEEMRALPRAGLGTRLGARARDVLSLVDGDDRAPLASYLPPEIPEEEAALEYGVEGTQALTFVAKTLTDRLAARLQGRAVAASRLELELHLDAAMLRESTALRAPLPAGRPGEGPLDASNDEGRRAKIDVSLVELELPAPLSTAGDLLAALRPKIERLVLGAPVLGAKLRAPVLVHKRAAALSLFEPQPKAERALPRLVAELVADLGPEAVSALVLGDSWVPEERSRLVPFKTPARDGRDGGRLQATRGAGRKRRALSSVPEPTRLLAEPRPVAREDVRVTRHLSRVESVAWWKTAPASAPGAANAKRGAVDYVQAWTDDGAAWIEIDRATGAMRVRGWFD